METQRKPLTHFLPISGLKLHVLEWPGPKRPFVLVHGLASNAQTWSAVARYLSDAGHRVAAIDQRGHGLSEKPDEGYGFDEVTADLLGLTDKLDLAKPIIAGQSWGGNVALDFAARYPDQTSGLILVDGGFIDLSARPNGTWEQISVELKPPVFEGRKLSDAQQFMKTFHPQWTEEGLASILANLEVMPDGAIRPHLRLESHMKILRSLWEQRPSVIYPLVRVPVLLAAARSDGGSPQASNWPKEEEVAAALAGLSQVELQWFDDTDHDIHVHRPRELAEWILQAVETGYLG